MTSVLDLLIGVTVDLSKLLLYLSSSLDSLHSYSLATVKVNKREDMMFVEEVEWGGAPFACIMFLDLMIFSNPLCALKSIAARA